MKNSRRHFLQKISTAAAASLVLPHKSQAQDPSDVAWYNVQEFGVEGRGWTDVARYYDRFPSKAEGVVRDNVWNLSRHSAGMVAHFATDSPSIHIRYDLFLERLAMPHMPATGVSGCDLYARDASGEYRWLQVTRPSGQHVEAVMVKDLSPGIKHYRLYLPLYNGVDKLEIGVDQDATFAGISPRDQKPIVFYGTSIMHGACASRPGMAIPALLGRRIGLPVMNLGFSGNGRMEPEVGSLLSELNPAAYVIDCSPNMNDEMINERALPLVKQLRAAHRETPILLVEDRINTNAHFFPTRADHHRRNRNALRNTYSQLQSEGVNDLYYLRGENLLGQDGDGATDGSHPSDLGMVRYADAYEPALRDLLNIY